MLAPWKESYDQPRQHIDKQRHYFPKKGPSSQGYGFSCGHVWMRELDCEESWAPKNDALNCGVGEDSWESLGLQGDPTSPSQRRSVLGVRWKDWCWSWNSSTLATSCEELAHLKRPWCWERLRAGEGDDRGWDGWMASPTRWTWVCVDSRSWWWTGRPGALQFMGSQRVGQDWATELNWSEPWKPSLHYKCGMNKSLSFIPSFPPFLNMTKSNYIPQIKRASVCTVLSTYKDCGTAVQNTESGARLLGYQPLLCQLPAVWPWGNCLTSLCLTFLICNMGWIKVCT